MNSTVHLEIRWSALKRWNFNSRMDHQFGDLRMDMAIIYWEQAKGKVCVQQSM